MDNNIRLPERGLYRRLQYGELIRQRNNRIYNNRNRSSYDHSELNVFGFNRMEDEHIIRNLTLKRVNEISKVKLSEYKRFCIICQDTIQSNEIVRELKCKHMYHIECVDKWLCTCARCPLCNMNF
jgi:hypothetical protein